MLRLWRSAALLALLALLAAGGARLAAGEESEPDEPLEPAHRAAEDYAEQDPEGRAANPDEEYADAEQPVARAGATKKPAYYADWDDLDNRPLPEWYDRAKVGFHVHWGLYSVVGRSQTFWYDLVNGDKEADEIMKNTHPNSKYEDFAHHLTGRQFHPDKWAKLFKNSGARYVVWSAKGGDGFAMFPSRGNWTWSAAARGPRTDVTGAVAKAVRAQGLKFGVAYSLKEWFNPLFLDDKNTKFKNKTFVDNKVMVELNQLISDYSPSVLWANDGSEAPDSYWRSRDLLAKIFNEGSIKDEVVVNDRWGADTDCKHGSFYNCKDGFNPGKLYEHKWENYFSLDKDASASRRSPDQQNLISVEDIIRQIASTVSCGGNVLISVGASKNGNINPVYEERLELVGEWLTINGPAIYGSQPFLAQQDALDASVWYTCTLKGGYDARRPTKPLQYSDMNKVEAVYAICLSWPKDDVFKLKGITQMISDFNSSLQCDMLGHPERQLTWTVSGGVTSIQIPDKLKASLKSQYAWTLRFSQKKLARSALDEDDEDFRRLSNGTQTRPRGAGGSKRKHNRASWKQKQDSVRDGDGPDDEAQNVEGVHKSRSARKRQRKSRRRHKSMRKSNSEVNRDPTDTDTTVAADDAASLPAAAGAGPAADDAPVPVPAGDARTPTGEDDAVDTAQTNATISTHHEHKINVEMLTDYHTRLILWVHLLKIILPIIPETHICNKGCNRK